MKREYDYLVEDIIQSARQPYAPQPARKHQLDL